MKTPNSLPEDSAILRQKAEEELNTRKTFRTTVHEVDYLKLIHELQVHQIELEMQNEELMQERQHAEACMERYTDLYDFAPSGYLTLSEEGDIIDLNFAAANFLASDRIHLKGTRFGLNVSPDSLEVYNQFFEQTFKHCQKESCELLLTSKSHLPIYVHIDAILSQNTNICVVTMIDITERKLAEKKLHKTLKQLNDLNRYFIDRELRMIDLKEEINALLIKSGCEKEYLI